MKRPPGIWILLSAGVLWLSLQDVYGIRATALIFGRSTTSTTPPGPVPNATDGILEAEVVTESSSESTNSTKTNFTGNPQLDYIFDPNLPKELNGYNLSDYPFYERVPDPEEIDFKCDGLHDGFYASIPYKCQVYHHCLFGTRYDFLCANYTAFDQKTFICQFVSDVDCVGSKKFWHRNDALYKATTTTTLKPLNIYTPPPDPEPAKGGGGPRGGGKRRRPAQRRPQYDYYDEEDYEDDYYEDRPRSRRRRPRPRPRPIYEDEYDEDYEEEYERRNRRPYKRRGGSDRRRNRHRNKNDDEVHRDEEVRPKPIEDEEVEVRSNEKKKPARDFENDRRNPGRDDDSDGDRSHSRERDDDDARPSKKKPVRSDRFDDDVRVSEKRKPPRNDPDDEDYDLKPSRPRKGNRRPSADADDREDERRVNRPRKKFEDDPVVKDEEKTIIKPTTGTIYDRPRVAPKIKRPVPKNEADKYAYKPIAKVTTPAYDEEYYDDYEEDLPPKPKSRPVENDPIKPKSSNNKERKQASTTSRPKPKPSLDEEDDALTLPQKVPKPGKGRGKDRYRSRHQAKTTEEPFVEEEIPRKITGKLTSQSTSGRSNDSDKKKIVETDYYDEEYEIEKTSEEPRIISTEAPRKKWKPTETTTSTTTQRVTTKPTTIRTTEAPYEEENYKERTDQVVRIVKRPFLPSRGGNPYSTRNLQPVGAKALSSEVMDAQGSVDIQQKHTDTDVQENRSQNNKAISGPRNQNVYRQKEEPKFSEPISDNDNDFKPIKHPHHILRPHYDANEYNGPRTTQKPKVPERNPLDINENEYDVTLNDALNPTLPNLPVRQNFPPGYNTANDYTFSTFQRQRYVLEPVVSNTDYVYQQKQPAVRQRFEAVPHSYSTRDQYVAPSSDYKNFYSSVANSNPRRGSGQAQAFYTTTY